MFGVLGIAGSYAGSLRQRRRSRRTCCWPGFWCCSMLTGGGRSMVPAPPSTAGAQPGQRPLTARHAGRGTRSLVAAAATGVGLITGFFGVGGGFVVVPALVLVLGFDMATAAGTSLVVIAVNSAAALAVPGRSRRPAAWTGR